MSTAKRTLLITGIFLTLGLLIGIAIGIAFITTGIWAPFGAGILGFVAVAVMMGTGLAIILGSLGFGIAKITQSSPVDRIIISTNDEFKGSITNLKTLSVGVEVESSMIPNRLIQTEESEDVIRNPNEAKSYLADVFGLVFVGIQSFFKNPAIEDLKNALESYINTVEMQANELRDMNTALTLCQEEYISLINYKNLKFENTKKEYSSIRNNASNDNCNYAIDTKKSNDEGRIIKLSEINRLSDNYPKLPFRYTSHDVLEIEQQRIKHHNELKTLLEDYIKENCENINLSYTCLGT
ncbi:MAG: hypothetical protein H0U73_14390 [Tatlockia sp.]|nr:hypothetical protein [Tatlockia sp.]